MVPGWGGQGRFARCPQLALQQRFKRGKSKSALPPTSDVDLYGEIVVDLKTGIIGVLR
jgi:hypothetical protein